MGFYKRFVEGSNNVSGDKPQDPSDKIITPSTAITIARPTVLSGRVCKKLLKGEKGVTKDMLAVGFSDMEGLPARLIDKFFPDSGRGTTKFGGWLDPIADSVALIEIAGAALFAPRVSKLGKLAILIACGHEAVKAGWALKKNREYRQAGGDKLSIKPTVKGKESMVEKFMAVGLAVSTNDIEDPKLKFGVGMAAVGHAISGTLRAERERRNEYQPLIDHVIDLQKSGGVYNIEEEIEIFRTGRATETDELSINPSLDEWYAS